MIMDLTVTYKNITSLSLITRKKIYLQITQEITIFKLANNQETAPSEKDNRKAFDVKSKVQPSETSFENKI